MARRGNNAAGGIVALIVAIGYGLVMFWYITVPVLVVWVIWYAVKKRPIPTPTVAIHSQTKPTYWKGRGEWREPYTPICVPRKRRGSYKPRKIRVSKPTPDPYNITFE